MNIKNSRVAGQQHGGSVKEPALISLSEAKARYGYSADTFRRWIADEILPAYRVGPHGHYRVCPTDLDAVIQRVRARTSAPPIDLKAMLDAAYTRVTGCPARNRKPLPTVAENATLVH